MGHGRGFTSTALPHAAQTAVAVEGNVSGVLSGIDAAVTSDAASVKDLADAALALAGLQATGDRRLWGKIFERAVAHKGAFDAASLTALLWAATAANVTHLRSVYELAGSAHKLLGSFTPTQLSIVTEALGRAGVDDAELFKAISDKVAGGAGGFSAADSARLLWGFAAAGKADAKLTKAAAGQLLAKAGEASARDVAQGVWALAKMGSADAATLEGLGRALGSKLGQGEAAADVAAALWGFASLNHSLDSGVVSRGAASIKAGAGALTPAQAIHAAWALALLGGDKDALGAALKAASDGVAAAPDAVPVPLAAMLFEAQAMAGPGAKVSDQVLNYTRGMYALLSESATARASAAAAAFRADVAAAAVRAAGAKYQPEVDKALAGLSKRTEDGLPVDIGLELDASTKVALELAEGGEAAGAAEARRRVLEARGWKVAVLSPADFAAAKDDKAKASAVLAAIRAQVPSAAGKAGALQKDLDKPFDPYA